MVADSERIARALGLSVSFPNGLVEVGLSGEAGVAGSNAGAVIVVDAGGPLEAEDNSSLSLVVGKSPNDWQTGVPGMLALLAVLKDTVEGDRE